MAEPVKNPFDMLVEQIRAAVREEISAASNGNGNGHSPTLLSAEKAAKLFDVPKSWISEAARRGEIPSVRLGHYVRFKPEDLATFIQTKRGT